LRRNRKGRIERRKKEVDRHKKRSLQGECLLEMPWRKEEGGDRVEGRKGRG